jgi:peptidoglycan/LPS O-acetylase OafA/YrhL
VIGVLLALYESEVLKMNTIVRAALVLVFGLASAYEVYSALYIEHVWAQPLDEIKSRIFAVTIFTLFIVFFASIWRYYDPIGRFLGKYSLYFYLLHTFLFMWAINHYEYEMSIRFAIATGVILIVSLALGIVITKISDIFYQKIQSMMDFRYKKG